MSRDGTIPVRPGEELQLEVLEPFLRERLEIPAAPLEVSQFPSGASNLTYLLRAGEWEAVLRRPPFGPLPPKAHDMVREAGLLKRIHPAFPLAPDPLLIVEDSALLGAPFYLMERRRGIVLDDRFPDDLPHTPERGRQISAAMVDTLVRLHDVDWKQAGLGDFGKPDGFMERQVRGWIGRYEKAKTDEWEGVEHLCRWLTDNVPTSPAATVIHNDFKLNNMLLDPRDPGRPMAVVDWEMATIGDPLFDLAVALGYWVRPDDPEELRNVLPTVTVLPGFYSKEEFLQAYAEKSGRDVSSFHFYLTFAYFKLAVILQQIYARWKHGQTKDPRFAGFGERVRNLIQHADGLARAGRL
ncbi:MAG: phosphotransferase family protein [Firmicutes bacterium]|uniref:Predicted kinase, aminoglycoside phosphotransferase (APT) family n=1 Tax=Melghirimyces thermohalophilus TaxID=1236220 RepID=A0A1G6MQ23_9BACL|nr:phosphotransferase family protein [Melghirimyces thermohalophilus]MDA8354559.1 phosphotransferase family protein [Bacillota bacterium]SDC57571.1 Predicted kinase, aminoglycoside phosphotransferase (APT) family [Melghirimyces thermohalophilus]